MGDSDEPKDNKLESIRRYYRMDRRQIHFLRFLLEAYEGVAVLTTIDSSVGLVALLIAPGREAEATQLMAHLKDQIMIEPVPGPLPGVASLSTADRTARPEAL